VAVEGRAGPRSSSESESDASSCGSACLSRCSEYAGELRVDLQTHCFACLPLEPFAPGSNTSSASSSARFRGDVGIFEAMRHASAILGSWRGRDLRILCIAAAQLSPSTCYRRSLTAAMVPDALDTPNSLDIADAPDAPSAPNALNIPDVPNEPSAPNALGIPDTPDAPHTPHALDSPTVTIYPDSMIANSALLFNSSCTSSPWKTCWVAIRPSLSLKTWRSRRS